MLLLCVIIFLVGLARIQESSHIFIFVPLPILQMRPRLKFSKPAIILCHVKELPLFNFAITKFPFKLATVLHLKMPVRPICKA
jgi:hypothetical protein